MVKKRCVPSAESVTPARAPTWSGKGTQSWDGLVQSDKDHGEHGLGVAINTVDIGIYCSTTSVTTLLQHRGIPGQAPGTLFLSVSLGTRFGGPSAGTKSQDKYWYNYLLSILVGGQVPLLLPGQCALNLAAHCAAPFDCHSPLPSLNYLSLFLSIINSLGPSFCCSSISPLSFHLFFSSSSF